MSDTHRAAALRSVGRSLTVRTAATASAVVLAAAGAGLSTAGVAHADGHGEGYYGVWANNVNVREQTPWQCTEYPSVTNCPHVADTVSSTDSVYVYCQQLGQTVGGNPYWLWVITPRSYGGVMASYYIENVTNKIDGLREC